MLSEPRPSRPIYAKVAYFEKNLFIAIRQAPFHEQIHFKMKCPEYTSLKYRESDGLHNEAYPTEPLYFRKIHSLLGASVGDYLSRFYRFISI